MTGKMTSQMQTASSEAFQGALRDGIRSGSRSKQKRSKVKLFRHPSNLLDVALVQTLLAESVFPRMSCALCLKCCIFNKWNCQIQETSKTIFKKTFEFQPQVDKLNIFVHVL